MEKSKKREKLAQPGSTQQSGGSGNSQVELQT